MFQAMSVICPEEANDYFYRITELATEKREKIVGLKVLKDLNYNNKDPQNQEFIGRILDILEGERNRQALSLVDGNETEIENDTIWRLFYADGLEARYCTIDFTPITNNGLRQETLSFIRGIYRTGDNNFVTPVLQVTRYANMIIPCMSILSRYGISSLQHLTKTHLNAVLAKLQNRSGAGGKTGSSVNYIAEALIFLRKMHLFITLEDVGKTETVFSEVDVPMRANSLKHIAPATEKAMQTIEESYGDLHACVVLADKLLKALEARANDVCMLPVNCVFETADGTPYIEYTASKTYKRCKKTIPQWLAEDILAYASDTDELRRELGVVDTLLVYSAELREGSKRQAQVLNADKYNFHTRKLLKNKSTEDVRGKTATQTARQIRAAAGKQRFAAGQTPAQVAEALGNTEVVAFTNYRELNYRERADLYRDYYKTDM